MLRSIGHLAAIAAAAVFCSFIAGTVLAWWITLFTSHSSQWPSRQRRQ
jgi:hypothetical protein